MVSRIVSPFAGLSQSVSRGIAQGQRAQSINEQKAARTQAQEFRKQRLELQKQRTAQTKESQDSALFMRGLGILGKEDIDPAFKKLVVESMVAKIDHTGKNDIAKSLGKFLNSASPDMIKPLQEAMADGKLTPGEMAGLLKGRKKSDQLDLMFKFFDFQQRGGREKRLAEASKKKLALREREVTTKESTAGIAKNDTQRVGKILFGTTGPYTGEQLQEISATIQKRKLSLQTSVGEARGSAAAKTKEKFRRSRPVDNVFKRLIGMEGEKLTAGDLEDKGVRVPDKVEMRALVSKRSFTEKAIGLSGKAVEVLVSNPAAIGTSGAIARATNSILAQGRNILSLAGLTKPDPVLLDPKRYTDAFRSVGIRDLGGKNSRLVSLYVAIAFASAAADADSTGRAVSDKDIERFIRRVGGNAQDPNVAVRILSGFAQDIDQALSIQVNNATGFSPRSLFSSFRDRRLRVIEDKLNRLRGAK